MDILLPLLAALATFIVTPTASVPAFLSLAAVTLSIVTLVRSVRATPRPRLESKSSYDEEVQTYPDHNGDAIDYQALIFEVTNRANGTAYDVRVRISNGDPEDVRELGALEPDALGKASFNLVADAPWPGQFELSWWEYPKKKKLTEVIDYGAGISDPFNSL